MMKYLAESLVRVDNTDTNTDTDTGNWYCSSEGDKKNIINDSDLYLLISSLQYIINNDFQKIRKLTKYLNKVAELLNILELPIT